jgi:hypothetical protein
MTSKVSLRSSKFGTTTAQPYSVRSTACCAPLICKRAASISRIYTASVD